MPAQLIAAARWIAARKWQRLAGAVTLIAVLVVGLRSVQGRGPGTPLGLTLVAVVVCAAVVFTDGGPRRTPVPLPVRTALFAVMLTGSIILAWLAPSGPGFLTGLITAGAATRFPEHLGRIAAAATLVALVCAGFLGAHLPVTTVAVNVLGAASFFRVGLYANRLRARTSQAEHLLVELEESRAAQLHAATLAERQRLAREMHDVLAHSLSGLLLHLEGARLLAADEGVSPRLRDTVDRAHHLANSGLHEARQAIGTLRDEDLPGPERLPSLVGEFRRDTGIPAELAVTGTPRELGAQARLTLFRVAQEAMTNATKHASPDHVDVRLGYDAAGTRLVVEDFGEPGPASGDGYNDGDDGDDGGYDDGYDDGDGYGIAGMRERAELLGGTLAAGPTGSGFRVTLWLPA